MCSMGLTHQAPIPLSNVNQKDEEFLAWQPAVRLDRSINELWSTPKFSRTVHISLLDDGIHMPKLAALIKRLHKANTHCSTHAMVAWLGTRSNLYELTVNTQLNSLSTELATAHHPPYWWCLRNSIDCDEPTPPIEGGVWLIFWVHVARKSTTNLPTMMDSTCGMGH